MQVRKTYALKRFRDELVEVAAKHFDAYIRTTSVPSIAHKTVQEKSTSNTTRFEKSPENSCTNVVKNNSSKPPIDTKRNSSIISRSQFPKDLPNDELFLRLSKDEPHRAYSGFALLDNIESKLGSDKELIKIVLPTKSGLALSSFKGNLKALEEEISDYKICADALLEKASPWTSIRISNIPRSSVPAMRLFETS